MDTETITVRDTIIVPEVHKDTIFNYFTKDTVIIREGALTVKYSYNSHDSTVFLKGKCDEQTIIKERTVEVNRFYPRENWYWWVLGGVGIALFLALRKRK